VEKRDLARDDDAVAPHQGIVSAMSGEHAAGLGAYGGLDGGQHVFQSDPEENND